MKRLAIAILLLIPVTGRTQAPPPDPLIEGRRQFELADQELNLGHYEKALEHLEASYRLTSRPALLYNLGYVNKQLFARTRNIDYLTRSIDLFKTFLDSQQGQDAKIVEQRAKAQKELKGAEDDLAREQAARVKGEEALTLGEEFLRDGRVAEAKEQLARFVRTPGNERPGVVRSLQLQAGIAVAEKDVAGAAEAYARALALDRTVVPPTGASDEARRAFTQAQLHVGGTSVLTVSHTPAGSLKPGAPLDLLFSSSPDPLGLVAGVHVHFRVGAGAFTALPPAPPGKVSLPRVFTAALLPGARVQYYAEVEDARGAVLQHLGSPSLPFSVEVEHPPAKSVAKKWWFWAVTVGAVAAVAVGVGLGVTLSEPARPQVPIFTGLHVW